MGTEMDHARCSESLPQYLRGELSPAVADAVRRHLDDCAQCSAERAGLERLGAAAVEPLTAVERDRIHDGIAAAVSGHDRQTVIAPARRSFWGRLGPALAGVATLALIVTGALLLGDGTGLDSAGDAGGSAESGAGGGGAEGATQDAAPGRLKDAGGTARYAGDIGTVTVSSLSRDTRRRSLVREVSSFNSASGAGETADEGSQEEAALDADGGGDNLRSLQAQADVAIGRQIADCARSVAAAVPYETVPVYAATATLKGDRVLLLGFNWAKAGGEELDRFMLWGWPVGDCRVPVFYASSNAPKRAPE